MLDIRRKRFSFAIIAAVLALDAGAAKKLIFIGWDTGDLTPAEIIRNADALYEAGADGVVNFSVRGLKQGEWYGARVAMNGAGGSMGVSWQMNGGWRYDKKGVSAVWDAPDRDGWRTGWLLARVPDDVNGLVLGLGAKQMKGERLLFADVQLVKLRDAPDGAKELQQKPNAL